MSRDWTTVVREHQEVIAGLAAQAGVIGAMVRVLTDAFRAGRRVYACGNGGSAADAQHIACELLGRFKHERTALPVVALTTDSSTLTAIANDFDYTRVFARQVEGLAQPGDVLIALSTSGNAANVLAAAEAARARGAVVLGFTGHTGGRLAALCAHVLRVPHTASDRIQEAHVLAYHFICEQVEAALGGGHTHA